ncbi:MAG: 2-C-methyl-D-erythritol 2,4-cyclodiphosphate synthase [Phycisphaerales bacterium]|nr:2-C-methyl-D-erythritol 2,4-cyclodiphosphate synthase [Phycisphaerales bacterium]
MARVGIGTDLHRLTDGRPLLLGHVRIDHEQGLAGHSDGDVLLHAVIDAIAGAAGLPDIGEMFPDTDQRYKDADSGRLLERTMQVARQHGWDVVNVDVVVHAERPRLSGYKTAIQAEVARLLAIDTERVSIKAKTGEGLDAVGRGEAIGCTAVVGMKRI